MKLGLTIATLLSAGKLAEGRIYLDSAQCVDVTCDVGYTGTAGVSCAASTTDVPADFVLSGCSPLCVEPATAHTGYDLTNCDTTNGAISAANCGVTCANNYRSTGNGPQAVCSTALGTFSFTGCEVIPSCTLPSSTTGYLVGGCAAQSSRLTETQCSVTCDTASGYSGTASDVCATDGGTFALSGCENACNLPATTTGYTTAGCAGKKSSAECTVLCDSANHYGGTPQDSCSAPNGEHVLSGCSLLPECNVPADIASLGYSAGSCSGLIRSSQCTGLTCAAGYMRDTNTLEATCSSQGAAMGFTGCVVIPKCSAAATPGYDLTNCNTGGGNLLASACTPTCATNYGGQAVDTCASDGAAFTFAGCSPQCTLPTTTTGYTLSGCSGLTLPTSCTVQCASGYSGNAVLTCPSAGGTMTLSGCIPTPKCALMTPTPGYDTTNCNPGRLTAYGIFESQCNVACADGYTGSAQAVCSTDGGNFTLSGCVRASTCILPSDTTGYKTTRCATAGCGDFAIDTTSCSVECETGYYGTAADSCATNGGSFTLAGCVPMCVRPATNVGYNVAGCDTGSGAITAANCQPTCDTGYVSTGGGPAAACNSPFGIFTFSGCKVRPTCSLPGSHAGYTITNCPANSRADQCTMACDTANGYGGSPVVTCDTNGGTFGLSGCVPSCALPSTTTGYNTASCPNPSTSAGCTVSCDTSAFYAGNAQDSCTTASSPNAPHSFTGCSLTPQCNVPSTHVGYTVGSCTGLIHAAQCTGVQCDTGYMRDSNALEATCSSQGADMGFTGCVVIPKCSAAATAGYDLTNCNTGGGNLAATACTPTCATNYGGQAVDSCASDGAAFTFTGCSPQCNLPTTPTGYTISGCSGLTRPASCTVGCASGYTGTAELTCPSAGGTMSFSGCSPVPSCTLAVTPTPGYITTSCNPGRGTSYGITAANCGVSCAPGYTGQAMASCSSNGGTFTFSGCTRMDTCLLPSSTAGYKTTRCQTYSGCGPTDRAVDYAMRAVQPTALLLLLVGAMQWLKL